MAEKLDSMKQKTWDFGKGVLATLLWLGAAALGGTYVLGCGGTVLPPAIQTDQTLAIATGGQIRLYNNLNELGSTGVTPVPVQTITAANVLSVAFDAHGNLYYLANNGTSGSAATFFSCLLPASGLPFPACTSIGATVAGGQWLTIDSSGVVFATSRTSSSATIVSFPSASGPGATPAVAYTSNGIPLSYGGITVDSSDTLYVTEQATAATIPVDKLFKCTVACQASAGSQADITASITTPFPNSAPGGPLAYSRDGTTLFVGSTNPQPHPPLTLPVAFACTSGAGGLTCHADSVTFPGAFGADSPYINTVGIAANKSNDIYAAVLLNNGGDTTTNFGPMFFGFLQAGPQFACSTTPSNCRVNELPSVPMNSPAGSVAYGLAVSPPHSP